MTTVNYLRLPQTDKVQYPYQAYSQLETKGDRQTKLFNTVMQGADMYLRQKNATRQMDIREKELAAAQSARGDAVNQRGANQNYLTLQGQGNPVTQGGTVDNWAYQGLQPQGNMTADPKLQQLYQEQMVQVEVKKTAIIGMAAKKFDNYADFIKAIQPLMEPDPKTGKSIIHPRDLDQLNEGNYAAKRQGIITKSIARTKDLEGMFGGGKKEQTPTEKTAESLALYRGKKVIDQEFGDSDDGSDLSWTEKKAATEKAKRDHELWKRGLPQTPAQQKSTQKEREMESLRAGLPRLQEIAKETPMRVYRNGYQMNDDGTVYTDMVTGTPRKLPDAHKVIGKRGGPTALKQAGEHWDDAKEIKALLEDPEVKAVLNKADGEGLFDRAKTKWYNVLTKWLQQKGYGRSTKAYEAVVRIQKMASDDRKKYLGVAITDAEMSTVRGWLIDTGDTFSEIVAKVDVISSEGEEHFINWLNIYKNQANMSSWYDTFGVTRFKGPQSSAKEKAAALIKQYGGGQ